VFDDLLEANAAYAQGFTLSGLRPVAAAGLGLLTCIDSRIEPLAALGLVAGDAKIVRNAGGRVTDDALRSLSVAVALLGVERIVVMHHTQCAMASSSEDALKRGVTAAGGSVPDDYRFLVMDDPAAALKADVDAIRTSPLLRSGIPVVGWRYDVATGRVTPEVV
jgi:carbonic anhydrase